MISNTGNFIDIHVYLIFHAFSSFLDVMDVIRDTQANKQHTHMGVDQQLKESFSFMEDVVVLTRTVVLGVERWRLA